ncbi:hypothetical protein [Bdellovibrio sp. HCB-162]|uniref:hypothetical protein n=1 Tax=Bdellovibrio sp. HCB-162 TaxID=3394234 RepID=UPI0039BC5E4D
MKRLVLLLSFIVGFTGSTALAADCVSKAEMTEIASHFTQFRDLARKDFCFDGSQTSNLIATIMFMRKTAFEADMPKSSDELFSGRFSQSWYNYFIGRIDDLDVQSSCPKGVGAYVYGFGNTMYICPMMLTDAFSALDRASVFMHEARHIDGYPHTTCSRGARKGLQGACDVRISDGGSYAVTVETYAQLAKYATDLHPALKAYSLASAVTYADEAFETPARVDRQDELLLMSNTKGFFSLDVTKSNRVETLGDTPALGHIVSRAQHLILFPEDKNLPAEYLFTKNEGKISQAAGEAAIEYNSQTPAQRAELVDLHIGAQWMAKVYADKVKFTCDPRAATVNELPMNGAKAVGILYVNGYDRTSRLNYLMADDGNVYEFGCTESFRPFLRASSMKLDKNFKRIHKVGNIVVGLTYDGHLFQIDGTKTIAIQTAIDGQIYEIAPRQSYGFFNSAN